MSNVQSVSAAMSYQQSPQHDQSVPSDESIDSTVTANVSVDSFLVFEAEDFSTSTPAKAISIPAEPDSHQYIETVSHSESITSAITSSKASTEPIDGEDTAMSTRIIEQFQFHPSRVWDRK